ncbi:MAG TPA: ectonucleotide pyrophosphatase/phosphodiesterase [Opitutaceae bacterium]|nr:ectonucleotide pyrophosphatase/phosphodiesterase [Opitutaceae bacterium]
MKRRAFLLSGALALAVLFAVVANAAQNVSPPPLVLISMDAFRWDYCALHPAETPHLRELMRTGVTARALLPVFPSNTFPNHYTLVTGLYPSHHGIINNRMFDAASGEFFDSHQVRAVGNPRWWGGEPIWVTAIKQGGRAASWFWVGSETEIKGVRPEIWHLWDPNLSFESRLDELVAWLRRVRGSAPVVATFYLEEVNSIGHKFGPDSPELVAAVQEADARVGRIEAELHAAGLEPNFVVVSDHGMASISTERIVVLDDYLDQKSVQLDFDGPVAGLRPLQGDVDSLLRALAPLTHAKAYRAADLPARFHVDPANPRVPPVWIVPDEGWEIYFRSYFSTVRAHFNHGDHGYDPAFERMHATFIANGPSFRRGVTIPEVENIHVYNLLCAALGLKPAPNDGDDRLVQSVLRH